MSYHIPYISVCICSKLFLVGPLEGKSIVFNMHPQDAAELLEQATSPMDVLDSLPCCLHQLCSLICHGGWRPDGKVVAGKLLAGNPPVAIGLQDLGVPTTVTHGEENRKVEGQGC